MAHGLETRVPFLDMIWLILLKLPGVAKTEQLKNVLRIDENLAGKNIRIFKNQMMENNFMRGNEKYIAMKLQILRNKDFRRRTHHGIDKVRFKNFHA